MSWIEVQLSPVPGGRARLELVHTAHVDDERWAEFGPGAVGIGWDLLLLQGLVQHVASGGAAIDPEIGMAWPGTPEGRVFVAASSKAWEAASVADGTPAAEAAAAEERVRAFYTP